MIAATYSRKSTSQEKGSSGDSLSIERQRELARAFAASRGWKVVADFADDAISGADFLNRDGLARMLAAAQQTPRPFDVLVCMDESRIGRDQYRTGYVLQQLHDAGVAVWFYQEQRQAKLDDATGKFLESVRGFASEMERERAKARTREALRKNAQDGHVPSGRVFGYRNVRDGAHAKRVIHEPEAHVVRRIFDLIAQGWGLHRIVRILNNEAVPAPNRNGWAATSIRAMLNRPIYRGRVVYGQTRRVDRGGRQRKVELPKEDWIIREAPELRIVPKELWHAAHARLNKTREVYDGLRTRTGTLRGRPESGLVSKHLLAGFLRCGQCDGTLFVQPSRGQGPNGKMVLYFRCTTHWKWGNARCTNRFGVPYVDVTEQIVGRIRTVFLSEESLTFHLEEKQAERQQAPQERQAQLAALRADVKRLDGELARLSEAIAVGGELRSLVAALEGKQRQRDEVAAKVEHLERQAQDDGPFDEVAWLAERRAILADTVALLSEFPVHGRMALRYLLEGPIALTPVLDAAGKITAWDFAGKGHLDPEVFSGRLASGVRKANTTAYQPVRRAAPARSWSRAPSTIRARAARSRSWR
jgi:site-specific DNA recombinase